MTSTVTRRAPFLAIGTVAVAVALAVLRGGAPAGPVPAEPHGGEHPAPTSAPIAAPRPAVASTSVSADLSAKGDRYVLTARIVARDGRPANDTPVRFYDVVDLLGTREMLIAGATTDGQGVASVAYLPATAGSRTIVVRSAAKGAEPAAEGRLALEAKVAAPPYEADRPPLADFTGKIPYAVGVLVLLVWFAIGLALLGTVRGVALGATRATRKEDLS